MRSSLIILSLIMLLGGLVGVSGQPVLESVRTEELLGPVKTVEESMTYFAMSGGQLKPWKSQPVRRLSFDRYGNMIDGEYFGRLGNVERKLVFSFDDDGMPNGYRLKEMGYVTKDQEHRLERDEAGRIWVRQILEGGKPVESITYLYNSGGELLEEASYGPGGTLWSRTVTVRDPVKRTVTKTRFNPDGKQEWKWVELRDAEGRLVREESYREETLTIVHEKSYDNKGRILQVITSRPDWPRNQGVSHDINPGKLVYKYDDARRIVERADYGGWEHQYHYYNSFERRDEKGDLVEDWRTDGKGKPEPVYVDIANLDDLSEPSLFGIPGRRFTEYEYDKYGNWIKKKRFLRAPNWKGLVQFRTEERKITYY